jgi:protocatechuate 3,4-dioxygenase beta subunit
MPLGIGIFLNSSFGDERISGIFTPLEQTPMALIFDNLSKPSTFNKNNNLVRKTGSFKFAIGEPLYIKGVVTDAFNVPIEGVIIKIWQTNAAGKYHTLLNKNSKYIDKNFLMSGQSITNNMGRYEFVTIFPGFYDDRAPHVNIIISHRKFGIIETEIYFDGHLRNSRDPIYMTYPEEARKQLTASVQQVDRNNLKAGKIATFNIVLDGVQQYKKY